MDFGTIALSQNAQKVGAIMPSQADFKKMSDREIRTCITRYKKMRDNSQALLDTCGRNYSGKTKSEVRRIRSFADRGIQNAFAVLERRAK